ncbi:Methyl-accepting chemotaxis protein [hydrothermal vent metagenome]|uniref:Methyl-accepting chemotaxis protein n=1 Tax=hydrothermal vent metagenome TaxID=652676 RepID=A0A1W1CIJ9_9ZZZZ
MEKLSDKFKKSEKPLLLDFIHSDEYSAISANIGTKLTRFEDDYDYVWDVFFIDLKGNILYTNEHESDLGTSLMTGPYKDTKFADTFRKTLKDQKIHFSDLERYGPSNNMITCFLTAPIINENGTP